MAFVLSKSALFLSRYQGGGRIGPPPVKRVPDSSPVIGPLEIGWQLPLGKYLTSSVNPGRLNSCSVYFWNPRDGVDCKVISCSGPRQSAPCVFHGQTDETHPAPLPQPAPGLTSEADGGEPVAGDEPDQGPLAHWAINLQGRHVAAQPETRCETRLMLKALLEWDAPLRHRAVMSVGWVNSHVQYNSSQQRLKR